MKLKNVWFTTLLALMLVVLTACVGYNAEETKETEETNSESATTETEATSIIATRQ